MYSVDASFIRSLLAALVGMTQFWFKKEMEDNGEISYQDNFIFSTKA
jgi:hypothetical protein